MGSIVPFVSTGVTHRRLHDRQGFIEHRRMSTHIRGRHLYSTGTNPGPGTGTGVSVFLANALQRNLGVAQSLEYSTRWEMADSRRVVVDEDSV